MDNVLELAKSKGYEGDKGAQNIQEWLRTKKGIHPEIFFSTYHEKWQINNFFVDVIKNKKINRKGTKVSFYLQYEDAREEALLEILSLI
jgi:hypothetical protein